MDEELAQRITAHVKLTQQRPIPFPPATRRQIEEAELGLGFPIPEILKVIYLSVGNGGFGPGRGGNIIGLKGGYKGSAGDIVAEYDDFKKAAAYLGLKWRDGLLPFCEWGCNIFSCVDCTDSLNSIFLSEECDVRPEDYDLADFIEMWLNGVDILDVNSSPRESIEITNPFTRKKSEVFRRIKKRIE